MRKILVVALVIMGVFMCTSCATKVPYSDAGLVGDLIDKDYEVLGPVSVSGKVHNILGIIGWGGIGYNDLLEEARRLYPEADAVINVTEDMTTFTVALFYNNFGWDFSGLAIKYVDDPIGYDVRVDVSTDGAAESV